MSLKEYRLLMEAYNYGLVEEDFKLHRLAWLIARVAPAKRKSGKNIIYQFKSFDRFYDHKAALEELEKKNSDREPLDPAARYGAYLKKKRKEQNNG